VSICKPHSVRTCECFHLKTIVKDTRIRGRLGFVAARDPTKMIAKGGPHAIHNDKELEAYTKALFELTALDLIAIEQEPLLGELFEKVALLKNPSDVFISDVPRICALATVNGICHYKWYDHQN